MLTGLSRPNGIVLHNGTLASLRLVVQGRRKTKATLPLYLFSGNTKKVVETFSKYYGRHLAMKQYLSERRQIARPAAGVASPDVDRSRSEAEAVVG